MDIRNIIEEVIIAISSNQDIRKFIYKVQVVSHFLKNKNLSHWFQLELYGYDTVDNLPKYRILKTMPTISTNHYSFRGVLQKKNQFFNPLFIDNKDIQKSLQTIYITESITTVMEMIDNSKDGYIAFGLNEVEHGAIHQLYQNINAEVVFAKKQISITDLSDIMHRFRSTLLDIFLQINDTFTSENKLDFNSMTTKENQKIDNIVSNIFIEKGIVANNNSSIQMSDSRVQIGENNNLTESEIEKIKYILDEVLKTSKENINDSAESTQVEDQIKVLKTEVLKPNPNKTLIQQGLATLKKIGLSIGVNLFTQEISSFLDKTFS